MTEKEYNKNTVPSTKWFCIRHKKLEGLDILTEVVKN